MFIPNFHYGTLYSQDIRYVSLTLNIFICSSLTIYFIGAFTLSFTYYNFRERRGMHDRTKILTNGHI